MYEVSPCTGCKNRKVGCHSDCLLYIKWKQAKDEFNEGIKEGRKKYKVYADYINRRKN